MVRGGPAQRSGGHHRQRHREIEYLEGDGPGVQRSLTSTATGSSGLRHLQREWKRGADGKSKSPPIRNQFIQYSDVWLPGLGSRPETGELQAALLDAHRAFLDVKDGLYNVKVLQHRFKREGSLLLEAIQGSSATPGAQDAHETPSSSC